MPKYKGRWLDEFETTVRGIPCTIVITYYHPGSDMVREGPMAGPEEPPSVDWVILDRKGYEANWLHKKLTDNDEHNIYEEAVERMQG